MRIYLNFAALLVITLAIGSCSASKKITNPFLGSWDYTIANTPMGDVNGELVFTESEEKAISGLMMSDQGTLDMNNVQIEGNTISGDLMFEGTPLKMEASLEGTQMTGMIRSEFGDFPITGVKKMQ